ncbi:MAG TPA: tetratricopeptide repeat protein [Tepidisphaeraceae bacterium]|jgi:tetratricopeptide (TPR) repeat protein
MTSQQLIILLLAGLALGVALFLRFYQPKPRWKFIPGRWDFTTEHHMPDVLPVPTEEETRVAAGDFSFEEAITWMKRFVDSRQRHPQIDTFRLAIRKVDFYRQLADRMGRGRWGEVDEIAQRLAELDPLDPSASLARGKAMRQLGKLTSAMQFYQEALKLQPTSMALPEFAAVCRALGQPQRFRDALAKARKELGETHPLTIESRVQLGELVRIFADPTDPATVAHIPRSQYIANVRARLEDMDPDLAAAIPLGRSMLGDDMPELAEMVLQRCEQTFGERGEVIALRGMLEHYERDLPAAERTLRSAVESDDSPAIRIELARVLLDRARQLNESDQSKQLQQEAEQNLRLAIDRDPDALDAIDLLAERHHGNLDAAIAMLDAIARAYPQSWAVWKVLGDVYGAESQLEQAIGAYQQGLSRQRTDALLMPYLNALSQGQRTADLRTAVEAIDDLDGRDPMLRWHVAQIYFEWRRMKEAKDVLESLVEDETASPSLRQRARDVLGQLDEDQPDEQRTDSPPRR